MNKQRRRELIVGVFIIIAVGIVMYLIVQMGGKLFVPQYRVTTYFRDAAGTLPGTPVTLAGVNIGSVSSLQLLTPEEVLELEREGTLVRMVLTIDRTYSIPVDSQLILTRSALLGEQILVFEATTTMVFLPKDSTAEVWDTRLPLAPTEEVSIVLDELKESFSELIANVNAIIGDPQFQQDIKATTANIAAFTDRSNELADQLSATLDRSAALLETAEALLSGEEVQTILSKTSSIVTSLDQTVAAGKVNDLFDNLNKTNEQVHALMAGVKEAVDQQQGLLGRLLTDEQLADNVDEAVVRLRESAAALQDAIPRALAAIEQLRQLGSLLREHPSSIIFGSPAGKTYQPRPIGE